MSDNTPRERRHVKTKQAILRAARQIISRQGVEGLSMRTLAKKIDYSPSGLYKYFDSKEEIIDAIRTEGFERLGAHINVRIGDDLTPRQMLVEAAMAYLDFAEKNPEHYTLMFHIPRSSITVEHITDLPIARLLTQIIEAGIASGDITPREGYSPMTMVYHGWVTVHGMAMLNLSLLSSLRDEFDPLRRQIVESVIEGFLEP